MVEESIKKERKNRKSRYIKIGAGILVFLFLVGAFIFFNDNIFQLDVEEGRNDYYITGGICNVENDMIEIDMKLENLGDVVISSNKTMDLHIYLEDELLKETEIDLERNLNQGDIQEFSVEMLVEEDVSELYMTSNLIDIDHEYEVRCPGTFGDWN